MPYQLPRFRPSVTSTVLVILAIVGCTALGRWQMSRAELREHLAHQYESGGAAGPLSIPTEPIGSENLQWRRFSARGVFVPSQTVFLDNRVHQGVAGFNVYTPLKLQGSDLHILVNRGWIGLRGGRRTDPNISTPAGEVFLIGRAVIPTTGYAGAPQGPSSGRILQSISIVQLASLTGLRLQNFVLQQESDIPDGLVRKWAIPGTGAEKNKGYALQWFTFALLALVLFIGFGFSRGRKFEAEKSS